MDFGYSPSRGGTLHLSPTSHHRHHSIDPLGMVAELRRSMSRSPSKRAASASRSGPHTPRSPRSPPRLHQSPLRTSVFATPAADENNGPHTPVASKDARSTGPALRRSRPIQFKSFSRPSTRATPRRGLSDSTDNGNATPVFTLEQEHQPQFDFSATPKSTPPSSWSPHAQSQATQPVPRNKPPVGLFAPPEPDTVAKSSPLKRSDGSLDLEQSAFSSPSTKRRSLNDGTFELSRETLEQMAREKESREWSDDENMGGVAAARKTRSPPRFGTPRRSGSQARPLMRSSSNRNRRSLELESEAPASSRTKRSSLDGAVPTKLFQPQNAAAGEHDRGMSFAARSHAARSTRQGPHPLSKALSPAPPSPGINEPMKSPPVFESPEAPRMNFAKSLPLGALRPPMQKASSLFPAPHTYREPDFSTPALVKFARPDPAAFKSTGLISKVRHNADEMPPPPTGKVMPDTPIKKSTLNFASFTPSPAPVKHIPGPKFHQPDFGAPSKPSLSASTSFGSSGGNPFGPSSFSRRDSLVSNDGEELSKSPSGRADSQSSSDEFPPTPTKLGAGHSKPNSLRSSIFGRRPSLHATTFVNPSFQPASHLVETIGESPFPEMSIALAVVPHETDDRAACRVKSDRARLLSAVQYATPHPGELRSGKRFKLLSPPSARDMTGSISLIHDIVAAGHDIAGLQSSSAGPSPHTPADAGIPDPSKLSISPRPGRLSQPRSDIDVPETPSIHRQTTSFLRDHHLTLTPSTHAPKAEVDPAITSRFKRAEYYSHGEFSEVFRVYQSVDEQMRNASYFCGTSGSVASMTPNPSRIFIVKKTKHPYTSHKARERALREVTIMKALGGNEHMVQLYDSWEVRGHLYIQTEFCEEGSLDGFLEKIGNKGRLDDFRIWKILIELAQGVQHIHSCNFIHLDLKPENVFIDFSGMLKIGDFGMASEWPAPRGIDGEGDRRYMGPETLQGKYDKPADIFALGIIIFEIASNCEVPDNGASWQQLRSGDFSGLPSLTSASTQSLLHDSEPMVTSRSFDPMDTRLERSSSPLFGDLAMESAWKPASSEDASRSIFGHEEAISPPAFMTTPEDAASLDSLVRFMMLPNASMRPNIEQVLQSQGCQWVAERRRSGATVFEGVFGPPNHSIVDRDQDAEMLDV